MAPRVPEISAGALKLIHNPSFSKSSRSTGIIATLITHQKLVAFIFLPLSFSFVAAEKQTELVPGRNFIRTNNERPSTRPILSALINVLICENKSAQRTGPGVGSVGG